MIPFNHHLSSALDVATVATERGSIIGRLVKWLLERIIFGA